MASVAAIQGLNQRNATKLRKAGIRTTEALLKSAATRRGRRDLANETGIEERQLLLFVNRADLMRVKGIGSEYCDLLEAAGVDTIRELRRRNPTNLLDAMTKLNNSKRLVKRLPTHSMVTSWVESAKVTEPMTAY